MATFRNTFSDYRRWVSPALFNATLESQLEQWWPKGQYFSQAVVNFQTSRAQLLPNLADNFNWTSMETLIWNSSPMALPFANCNFGIQTVPDELSNFMIWLTVPREYFQRMSMAILSGQLWNLNPEDFAFTSGQLNYHFSPRSALLFYVFQFSISQVQRNPVDFNQMKSPITFGWRLPKAYLDNFDTIWNRWYFDFFVHFQGNPPFFDASTLLGRAILQGMVLFDHVNIDMFKLLSYFNGLRNHDHFCMLMHMPSIHETLNMVQAGQVDFQTPAPPHVQDFEPRWWLWKLSFQAGWLFGNHFESLFQIGTNQIQL